MSAGVAQVMVGVVGVVPPLEEPELEPPELEPLELEPLEPDSLLGKAQTVASPGSRPPM